MALFLNQIDREQIIKSLSSKIMDKDISTSLDVWDKIWKYHSITYNFFYDDSKKSVVFIATDGSANSIGQGFSVEYILHMGFLIQLFYQIPGIQDTLRGFRNYPQFSSTLFELICANQVQRITDQEVTEFSPKIIKAERERIPDFKYKNTTSNKIAFSECKSIPNLQRVQQSNIGKLYKAIYPELKKINKSADLRIEISFSKLPEHWSEGLGTQLRAAITEMLKNEISFYRDIELNFTGIDVWITIQIRKKENKIRFSNGWIFLGDNNQNPLKSNYFIAEGSNVDNAFKRQIKDARDQLPDIDAKHIFVELLPAMDVNYTIKLLEQMTIIQNTKVSLYKDGVFYTAPNIANVA